MKTIDIDLKSVRTVLLADGWHAVVGESFVIARFRVGVVAVGPVLGYGCHVIVPE